jgi:GT2 family glycosyltransferase
MKFSLVQATLGRSEELARFLPTLDAQTHRDFELIVIDQNPDDRMVPILAPYYDRFPLLHLRSAKGLCKARNVGFRKINGELICFPDDDCLYPPDLLERVNNMFTDHPEWDGINGKPLNDPYWHTKAGDINRFNLWKRGISFTIFVRRTLIDKVGLFDESLSLGAGTPWGAADETDYLLGALQAGCKLRYEPSLAIPHPGPINQSPAATGKSPERAFRYAMGTGRVIWKRGLPFWYAGYRAARPLVGAAAAMGRMKWEQAKIYLAVSKGITRGYLGWA